MKREKKEIESYYNDYAEVQIKTGINQRHHSILRLLRQSGLRRYHRVLEVGCGIGALTYLLARYLSPRSELVAIDISPKSVEIAQQRLRNYPNCRVFAGEAEDILPSPLTFDVIVLPDVLEHIPLEQHKHLFMVLRSLLTTDGFIFIHIPHPNFLRWSEQHLPDTLQLIDQPVYTDKILSNAYPAGFYLHHLNSYGLWRQPYDYQVIVLKVVRDSDTFTLFGKTWMSRALDKLNRLIKEYIWL